MKRLITAIGLLAVAFYLIFLSPGPVFLAAALVMSFLCYREYANLVVGHSIPNPGWVGLAAGLFLVFWPHVIRSAGLLLPALALLVILMFISALRLPDLTRTLPYVSCSLLGAFYTFAPWRFAIDLRNESIHLVFFALALNWAGDSVAYYVGRRFGKHRMAPVISPKKSWEGAIAAVIGSAIFGVLYLGYFLPALRSWEVIAMALMGNVAGQLGDLAESSLKRGAGVKDSGSLLPGHGGMLDRVDSSLFALPVVFAFYLSFHHN